MENPEITEYRVGDAVITKVAELTLDAVPAGYLYPGSDPTAAEAEGRRLDPGSVDARTGLLRLGVHA